jgi:lysophospholipase L1-like esterase
MMRNRTILLLLAAMLLLFVSCARQRNQQETEIPTALNERTDETMRYDCDAVFFGDSITCDGNFDEIFPELRIVNLGVYGDTLKDLLRRVPEVKAENPARIFLLGGINALRDDNAALCLEEYAALLDALRAECPEAELVVQSVLPVGADIERYLGCSNETIRAFNASLEVLAGEKGCGWVDLWPAYELDGALNPTLTRDGVHLNFNAYSGWRDSILDWMERQER